MAQKSCELRVISYYTYADGNVALWNDLSESEKIKIRKAQAKQSSEVMSEYYRTHKTEFYKGL